MTDRIARLSAASLILWAALGAGISSAWADPLPNPPPRVLPDPSPRESRDFPPAMATSGTADPGRKLAAVRSTDPREESCNTLNPCAVPPPSRDRAETVPSRAPLAPDPG
jgi:hypothetical protein